MPGGRPTKYRPEYAQQMVDYFKSKLNAEGKPYERHVSAFGVKEVPEMIPTFQGFAVSIDVDHDTLMNWRNATNEKGEPKYPEFFGAYKKCKAIQYDFLAQNAIRGNYNPAFSIFFAKNNLEMVDEQVRKDVKMDVDEYLKEIEKLSDSSK